MNSNKNERRKRFISRLKKRENTQINEENANELIVDKKENEIIEEQEPPSVIAERYLRKEIRGEAR